jgi:hypothetical protein
VLRDAAGASRADAEAAAANGADGGRLRIKGSQLCGADAGAWCAESQPSDWPPDQRAAEGQSLCFTSAPLAARVEILGHPRLALWIASDRPLALVAARLDDVAPDGVSRLVSQEVFNLTHRASHESPGALEPGRDYAVAIALDAVAYAFPAGHRLRLALSPTYWPWAWPSPEPVTLTVVGGSSQLELPVRPPRAADSDLPPFEPPIVPEGLGETIGGGGGGRSYTRDLMVDGIEWTFRYVDGGNVVLPNGWESEEWNRVSYGVREGEPLSARVVVDAESVLARGAQGRFHIVTHGEMTCDASRFFVEDRVAVFEGDDERQVFAKTWRHEAPRDLV